MINYQNDFVTLRALEPDDLDFLFDTENPDDIPSAVSSLFALK